jgi:hypothetical protein
MLLTSILTNNAISLCNYFLVLIGSLIRYGVVGNIWRSHRHARGSIPRNGVFFVSTGLNVAGQRWIDACLPLRPPSPCGPRVGL